MSRESHEFDGKRALVSGSTKGIGHAVTARLAEGGATVLVNVIGFFDTNRIQ